MADCKIDLGSKPSSNNLLSRDLVSIAKILKSAVQNEFITQKEANDILKSANCDNKSKAELAENLKTVGQKLKVAYKNDIYNNSGNNPLNERISLRLLSEVETEKSFYSNIKKLPINERLEKARAELSKLQHNSGVAYRMGGCPAQTNSRAAGMCDEIPR